MDNGKMSIAVALSGGGYRAASFSLGGLTYLDHIKLGDESLLKSVSVLSTVSGGTITGSAYATGIKHGKTLDQIYDALYSFMCDVDLIKLCLERLSSNEGWDDTRVKSLINAAADVYDKHLFAQAKFGPLLVDDNPTHLKHVSFNATEFAHANQFRFQRSERLLNPKPNEPERGIIGNFYFNVPFNVAQHIRMADIMASSSCFPGGFEPINFPTDFILPDTAEVRQLESMKDKYPVGLMDGGIVDNQGIEPVLLADERIKRNQPAGGTTGNEHALDLIIVVDVASPYMEEYIASKQKKLNWWRRLTPAAILTINSIFLLASAGLLYYALRTDKTWLVVLSTFIFTINLIVFVITGVIKRLPKKFQVPPAFLQPIRKLLGLRLHVYENLIMNRAKSLLKLSGEVFLKHVRRLNYTKIFSSDSWKNRRIMTAIYELRPEEDELKKKIANGDISGDMIPSEKIGEVAKKAASMGTTLWFTEDELKGKMLDTLIACGQFTMCWNLLEYIGKIKKNSTNTNASHAALIACEDAMRKDWEKFQVDPFWMVRVVKKAVKE